MNAKKIVFFILFLVISTLAVFAQEQPVDYNGVSPESPESPDQTLTPEPLKNSGQAITAEPPESPDQTLTPEPLESSEQAITAEPPESPDQTLTPEPLKSSEQTITAEPLPSPVHIENGKTVYIIREMEFDVDGRSRPFALIIKGEFKYGEVIKGKANLDKYLANKRQLLVNERVLEEVSIEYFLGESEEDGSLPVKLLVHVKDTTNLVILPYPKYDSNDGLSITLKMRDYNFLGTMSPLRVDFGYQSYRNDNIINFSIDTDIPFQFAGLNWIFNFDHIFKYTFGEPLYYQNVTGLSVELPWETNTFTVGFNQYLIFNEENSDDNIDIYGLPDRYPGAYGATELFASLKIPFGIYVGNDEVSYTPKISGRINYLYNNMDESRKPVTTFSHTIGFGRANWIGNFRKGILVSLSNDYNWYVDRQDAPLGINLDANFTYYHPFSKYIGFSTRFRYRQWWQYSNDKNDWIPYYFAGDTIRGVIDDKIRANYMASFNFDLPIRLLRFWPSEWFNKPKLHFFDFEMHFAPFMDMALVKGPYSRVKNPSNPSEGATKFTSLGDMITTGGVEVIVFPGFFRSFYIRGSIGYDLKNFLKNGFTYKWGFFPQWDEIYIGVDLSY